MVQDVILYLDPKQGEQVLDGTVGQGGHAGLIVPRVLPDGRFFGIDRDATNLSVAKESLARWGNRAVFIEGTYRDAKRLLSEHGVKKVDGILLDLGFSSLHVDDPSRGFSFMHEGPLDMRYDQSKGRTAADIVNRESEDELARLFRVFGEEPNARQIAQAIVATRENAPIVTTLDLAHRIEAVVPRRGKIHPATRVFQALRIEVNEELSQLEAVLPDLVDLLNPGGRLVIISFHSLEDRIVKKFFRSEPRLDVLTPKPIRPSLQEIRDNPRARSSHLRAARRNAL